MDLNLVETVISGLKSFKSEYVSSVCFENIESKKHDKYDCVTVTAGIKGLGGDEDELWIEVNIWAGKEIAVEVTGIHYLFSGGRSDNFRRENVILELNAVDASEDELKRFIHSFIEGRRCEDDIWHILLASAGFSLFGPGIVYMMPYGSVVVRTTNTPDSVKDIHYAIEEVVFRADMLLKMKKRIKNADIPPVPSVSEKLLESCKRQKSIPGYLFMGRLWKRFKALLKWDNQKGE